MPLILLQHDAPLQTTCVYADGCCLLDCLKKAVHIPMLSRMDCNMLNASTDMLQCLLKAVPDDAQGLTGKTRLILPALNPSVLKLVHYQYTCIGTLRHAYEDLLAKNECYCGRYGQLHVTRTRLIIKKVHHHIADTTARLDDGWLRTRLPNWW